MPINKKRQDKIAHLEFEGGNKQIVFLHGWGTNSRSFLPLIPYLYNKYKVHLIDLPGFGKSQFNSKLKSSFDYAEEIIKWIKSKKIKNIYLTGHSFGGKIAAIIARKEPQLVKKLILIAPSGIKDRKLSVLYKIKAIIPQRIISAISPFAKRHLASRDYKEAGKLLPLFKNIVKENLEEVFREIKVPTLIIWGKDDRELNQKYGKKINSLVKNSKLKIVEGDHFPFLENPKKIAKLIENFIENGKD
jgi:pimeloyl-ACP methyl ester carboxylesterase